MRGKTVGLVFLVGCASPSFDGSSSQQVADPSPTFAITRTNFVMPAGGSDIASCGSAPADLITCPTGDAQIRWGQPADPTDKSGLGFTKEPGHLLAYNTPFKLGTLTHFNWPTLAGTSATGAQLSIHVTVTPSLGGALIVDDDAAVPFSIDETPNYEDYTVTPPITCPYPSAAGNPCSDRVTFGTATFHIGSSTSTTVYDLHITGFVAPGTTTQVNELISNESQSSSAELWGLLREQCLADADNDGICDEDDNCVNVANTDQVNSDSDAAGDACDPCPTDSPDDPDNNGVCGLQEACPCDADWKNHGDYVTCVVKDTKQQVRLGLLTDQQRAEQISAAAQNTCGH